MDEFLITGIGASAGGIQALKEFFTHVPRDSGIAYVVILHLSPDYESHLAEVLQTSAAIPVEQVREQTRVEPNRIYVIPPHESLALSDGYLQLSATTSFGQRRAPVDLFFRTLADSRGMRAACVVLSGTGANGSMGLKRVKERGGLCIAQDPADAEYSDMPRNAIATGLVDHVLPIAEIPDKLIAYQQSLHGLEEERPERLQSDEQALGEVFALLKARTGQDFSNYKKATILRRLARRMSLRETADYASYLALLRERPEEAHALVRDLLISVTNFFRDREAFEVLERLVIPRIFAGKGEDGRVRVWVPGCATGEEAYSIAMLLAEHAGAAAGGPSVQLFATDVDESAIAVAREGLYSLNDAADVSPERLGRFFVRDGDAYRVRKELREMILFAQHNVIRDPPFSHLDLISCRNLLIYLNRSAQQRLMEVLHFALNGEGYLFLGSSESIDGSGELFVPLDKEASLFQSRGLAARVYVPAPELSWRPGTGVQAAGEQHSVARRERISAGDLHVRLLEQYGPPSIVVNEEHEIVHLSEHAGQYLQFPGGEPSHDLLRSVRPELRTEVRTALYQAAQRQVSVESPPIALPGDGQTRWVRVIVRPVLKNAVTARGFLLVIFAESPDGTSPPVETPATPLAARDGERQLEEEVSRVKAQLRVTIELHESQAEELKASNEELQAMNEELRSSAEELETSKEELQSLNEELRTLNQELKIRIDEQSEANNVVHNLINSTEIGTIFLDRRSRIRMFTPRACDLFNLIPSDRGRPLSDISSTLPEHDLHADIERVLDRLERVEREVRTRDGAWYLLRVTPYRTADDYIDGTVLTFTDVTGRRRMEDAIRTSEARLQLIAQSVTDHAIVSMDAEGRIESWNPGAERLFGLTEAEARGQPVDVLYDPADRDAGLPSRQLRAAREHGRAVDERWHQTRTGARVFVSAVLSPLRGVDGAVRGFVQVARDTTERRQSEDGLRESNTDLEQRVIDRTHALSHSNSALERELLERRQSEERIRELLKRVISVQDDERRSVARELHDQLGQQLTALSLKLDALAMASPADETYSADVEAARAWIERMDHDLDLFIWQLRPILRAGAPFVTALEKFVREWSDDFGVPVDFHSHGLDELVLTPEVEANLSRITQEALNNVLKHARASHVSVLFERNERTGTLVIEDNGVGFEPGQTAGHRARMGLTGLRERAEFIGGTLDVESSPGKGTTVLLRFPLIAAG